MAWSEAQLLAIETYDKNLLVAAAAGSGKTSVLVERIIRRILDETQDFQISEALVVTFTNAAATEMRERISAAIEQALKENPASHHLQRQLALMNTASISTLHAFCQSVIRQNFHRLDLDPKFRLITEQEGDILRRDVLEALFEECYGESDPGFLTFVDHYGDERGDEELYEIILRLYDFSCSQPFPALWIKALPEQFRVSDGQTVGDTVWAVIIRREVKLLLQECVENSAALCEMAVSLGFDFYAPVLESDREMCAALLSAVDGGWDELREAVQKVKFAVLRAPKDADEAQKEYFKKKRAEIKDNVKKIKETYLISGGQELMETLSAAQPLMETICRLTVSFGEAFRALKQTKAMVDFSDLEHLCLALLADENLGDGLLKPSPIAKALQKKYREVMVDEYQDVNGVQEAILSLVRRAEEPNLFLVGDVKQSIYRFRLAEPELFLEKYRAYPQGGDDFSRIDLAQNFRSKDGVLAAINFVFTQVMSPEIAELSYGEAERLNPGALYPKAEQRAGEEVELHLIDGDGLADEGEMDVQDGEAKGFALESRYIAERIRHLIEEQTPVFDKAGKTYRPATWSDIVVLLRSVKGKADVLLETLRDYRIPAYANADSGYFQAIEVQVMLSLLRVIDNPYQDIPLAAVLHSPIVGMSARALADIRLQEEEGALFAALLRATAPEAELPTEVKDKALCFLLALNRWRNLARQRSVPELIWQLYRDTAYYDYVGGMPGGTLRQANLRMLYDRAREYEATNFRGLFRFLRFIEKMRNMGTDLSVARTLGENENVVRIMSIHKSKGLEFPIVIVADLGKKFNLLDSKANLLIHKRLGLGPYVIDDALRVKYPTIARKAIACQIDRENKAEELRVLYVALTRAREKLILVGSAGRLVDKANRWCKYAAHNEALLPDCAIAAAQSCLDWLCPAVARHEDGAPLREYGECILGRLNPPFFDDSRWRVAIVSAKEIARRAELSEEKAALLAKVEKGEPLSPSEDELWVKERLDWRYPYFAAEKVPAKLSVTEMKRRFDLTDEDASPLAQDVIFARPEFIAKKIGLTGAEYGTLMHSVMQHIDLKGDLSKQGIKAQLAEMASREIIIDTQIPQVDLHGIYKYFHHGIGKRMLCSPHVRRELPFSVMLKAERFYPALSDCREEIFVQGIVDVLFDEGEEMVLIDYKTTGGSAEEIAMHYQMQINLYAGAIEKIFKRKIKEKYLYSFTSAILVKIE